MPKVPKCLRNRIAIAAFSLVAILLSTEAAADSVWESISNAVTNFFQSLPKSDPFPTPVTTNAVATEQTCQQTDPTHQVCFVSNPPLNSGDGGAYGPNHGLQSNTASPGYKLIYASFVLSGPHLCFGDDFSPRNGPAGEPWGFGQWAECWIISRTDTHVIWGYTMKGVQTDTTAYVTWDNGPGMKWEIGEKAHKTSGETYARLRKK